MRAAVLRDLRGHDFGVEDVPRPEPAGDGALVRILRSGICGSDLHLVFHGWAPPSRVPLILGHEAVGVVEGLGPDARGPEIGTRVAIHPMVSCRACPRCAAGRTVICRERAILGNDLDGTYAEFVAVPARNLVPVPAAVPHELAAVATDAVATAFHALRRGGVGPGSRIAVFGAGGLGTAAIGLARAMGAAEIVAVDPRESARGWALDAGADRAIHPDDARQQLGSLGGVDASFEFVGRPETVELAVRTLSDGGRAVVVGTGPYPMGAGGAIPFVLKEREVVGSYGSEPEELKVVLDMLADGTLRLTEMVREVVPLGDIVEAFHRLERGEANSARIVVDPTA